ncbi:MAG: FtsX-like permease family protein [Butyrivibrio sp.]|nr:FtsX-like permease family protein [Butyrivibrio sp.]
MRENKRIPGPKVNNKKVIRNIAYRTVKANRGISIVAAISIFLCAFMFTAFFEVTVGLVSKIGESNARQAGGTADAGLKYLNEEEYEKLTSDKKLKEVYARIMVGEAMNHELIKTPTEINYCDEKSAKESFCYPEVGNLPKEENEAVVSSIVLKALGFKADTKDDYKKLLGGKFFLKINGRGGEYEHEFVISGIFTGDKVSMAQTVLVSKVFQEKNAPTPEYSFYSTESGRGVDDYFGRINADIDFYIPLDVSAQLDRVIERNNLPDDVYTGINWGKVGGSFDLTGIGIIVFLLMTIFLSGYLIISNVYRINVYSDTRSYGLLKTVGTSSAQLRKIVKKQAVYHSIPGICAGIIGGSVVGNMIFPVIMRNGVFAESVDTKIHFDIWIYLFSALFSYITVRISIGKAMKLASRVMPMEALRYTETDNSWKRKSGKAGKFTPISFAIRNVLRVPKRLVMVVLSLSLSLVVLNSTYILVSGFDENKYIEQFVKTDFSVSDAGTDNVAMLMTNAYDGVTESFLQEIKKIEGVTEIGNVYSVGEVFQKLNERDYARYRERLVDNDGVDTMLRNMYVEHLSEFGENNTKMLTKVYGMDDYAIRNLKILKGNYDADKFKTGKYIIVNEHDSENERSYAYFLPGETMAVNNNDGEVREYEVMATVDIPYSIRIHSYVDLDAGYVLPSDEFLDFFGERTPMRTLIDTTDEAEPIVEKWMKDYTENVEPDLTYSSRAVYKREFRELTGMFNVVGILLTTILALIGILNLINTLATSVLSRKRELTMLEAVGMTKRTCRKSICLEGAIYGVLALIFGVIISVLFAAGPIRVMGEEMWFYSHSYTILPIVLAVPVVILLSISIPAVICKYISKETVVERLGSCG